MRLRRRDFVYAAAALAVTAWATPWAAAARPWSGAVAGWELAQARVISPGQVATTPQGTMVTGYTVIAEAGALAGDMLPEGVFRIVVNVFSPSVDMPGQQAGLWYLTGQWSITDRNASVAAARARYSTAKVKGSLTAELPFNPVADLEYFSAVVKLPTSPAAGRWARGEGTFSGNSRFEGTLMLERLGALQQGEQP